uniref:NADH-ubiquinone oxidoreductase chain 3 n=1 Tax=Paphia amabilis TaxID=676961 RepID=H6BHS7_9BIVA|nr:NADH dehydrogenase subunit 3 [Paphia amabilis]AEH99618.1 NADH dehydrogenase subunit 3 [Paphia amabilis]
MWFFEKSSEALSSYNSLMGVSSCVMLMGLSFMGLAVMVSQKWRYESDKLTSFECGFDPMSSSRMPFSLRFFLLALLFLVFDLEMVLFFPYVFSVMSYFSELGIMSKIWSFVFLLVLVLGLAHELNEGTLDWEMDE